MSEPSTKRTTKRWPALAAALIILGIGYYLTVLDETAEPGDPTITLRNAYVWAGEIPLAFKQSGQVARVLVQPGQRAHQGALLAYLESAPSLELALHEEELRLAAMEFSLPPSYAATNSTKTLQKSASERLQTARDTERAAKIILEGAAQDKASSAIYVHREQGRFTQGKLSHLDLERAKEQHRSKEQTYFQAREAYRAASTDRAEAEKEINRIKNMQLQYGAESTPVEFRIKAYEVQKSRVQAAKAKLYEANIHAPAEGVVQKVFIAPGQSIIAHSGPAISFMPATHSTKTVLVVGQSSAKRSQHLGLPCSVRIPEFTDAVLQGYTIDRPAELLSTATPGSEKEVWVRVTMASPSKSLAYQKTDATVMITHPAPER